jgi:transcription initiation factor TFIID subunit 9B
MANITDIPKPAVDVVNLLKSMGVEDYEPRVVNQLLDFMYRYVSEVLQDAEAFATTAASKQRGDVDRQEVAQAIQCRTLHSFVQPPTQPMLDEIATRINSRPLPVYKKRHGLIIPPNDEEYLAGPNFQYRPDKDEGEDDL